MGGWRELHVENFNLKLTLESGQLFRYRSEGEHYVLISHGREIRVAQNGSVLHYRGASASQMLDTLGIVNEHTQSVERLNQDPVLQPIVERYSGLRVMRLDLHETILGFICSSNSNIPRIRQNLERLAALCGQQQGSCRILPPAGAIIPEALAREAGVGYRAPFIAAANALLTQEMLLAIRQGDYAQSHALLCTLPGVGPKVADCVCLFALGHGEAFPVDVHVMRAMRALFPRSRLSSERHVKAFAQRRWGSDAGLAQQMIFQWARDTRRVLA